jgi:hypothetical protein
MAKIKNKHQLSLKRESCGENTKTAGKSLYNQTIFKDENIAEIEFEVKCSYVEIYNETIFDLLDNFGQ